MDQEPQADKTRNRIYLKIALGLFFCAFSIFLISVFFGGKIRQILTNTALAQKTNEQIMPVEAPKIERALPSRLLIPSIKVDSAVQYVGLSSDGAMDIPTNIYDVGWYQLGPSPGEIGTAVISGHFDGRKGEIGVFNNLDKLKPGDKISVISSQGVTSTFVVRESRLYNPGYADEVFLSIDNSRHLNLVTCDGTWDKAKESYTKRLVVFADIMQ